MTEMESQLPMTVQLSAVPQKATDDARVAAVYLKKLLDNKKKKVVINGKRHIEFEDWITLGNYYGIDVRTGEAEPVEVFGVQGAKAKAEVIRIDDGTVIGGAEAFCLKEETNWRNKPFFQIASMAQTRAGSKALSNVLRWVVALEGISGTPAEEMDGIGNKPRPTRKPPSSRPQSVKKDDVPKGIDKDNVQDAEVTTKPSKLKLNDEMPSEKLDKLREDNGALDGVCGTLETRKEKFTKKNILKEAQTLLDEDSILQAQFNKIKEDLNTI
jgi:hypothetical protein